MPLRCYLRSASPCFIHEERAGPCLVPSNRTLHYRNTGIVTDPCSAPLCDVCDCAAPPPSQPAEVRSEVVDVHLVYELSHACDHTHTHTHTHTLQAIETRQLHHAACCSTTIVERVFAAGLERCAARSCLAARFLKCVLLSTQLSSNPCSVARSTLAPASRMQPPSV